MNRYFWIAMTYATRPLVWLLGLGLMIGGIPFFAGSLDKYEDIPTRDLFRSLTLSGLNQTESLRNADPDANYLLHYGQIAMQLVLENLPFPADGGSRHITPVDEIQVQQQLDALHYPKHVVELRTESWGLTRPVIEHIATFTELRKLSVLFQSDYQTPLDLGPLARLTELESIDFGSVTNVESLAPLAHLPKLRTLSIGNHHVGDRRSYAGVRRVRLAGSDLPA